MPGYAAHYKLITSKLWASYPGLSIVASGRWGPPIAGSPCLTGQRCDVWDDHYYRTPDQMAAMGSQYDHYNRSTPKVFVGEFAANKGGGKRTLRAALAEGIFMIGFERNADVVVASSFAPLCNNMRGTQWPYNLINFNTSHLFVLPSYHAQALFSQSLGTETLPTTLTPSYEGVRGSYPMAATAAEDEVVAREEEEAPSEHWLATASINASTLTVKLVNYGPRPRAVEARWDGTQTIRRVMSAKVLTAASPDAENTLDAPDVVVPAALTPAPTVAGGKRLEVDMPPWSLVVVEAALG